MIAKRPAKSRGKLSFRQYFQEFKEGDKVAVVRELALNPAFPIRLQGRTGVISGKKGHAYVIKIHKIIEILKSKKSPHKFHE